MTCLVEYSEHFKTPACSGSVNICDGDNSILAWRIPWMEEPGRL